MITLRPSPRSFGTAVVACAAVAASSPASAGIARPASLDFGLAFADWGVYADGSGEGATPMQGMEFYDAGQSFGGSWWTEDGAAFAATELMGIIGTESSESSLVMTVDLAVSGSASVGEDAAGSNALASVSTWITELSLTFEVAEAANLHLESRTGDGDWLTLEDELVGPGFVDVSFAGIGLALSADPGQSLSETVEQSWRVTIATIPAPGALAVWSMAAALGSNGHRRRRRPRRS